VSISLTNHLAPEDAADALRADARAGLTASPKTLPPRWFYDERGSELFDEITRLPEYYPTRAERAVLAAHAGDIAAASGADVLVELGSGTSEKTRLLLDALRDAGTLRRFVPCDVDPSVLQAAGAAITAEYPGVEVEAAEIDVGPDPSVGFGHGRLGQCLTDKAHLALRPDLFGGEPRDLSEHVQAQDIAQLPDRADPGIQALGDDGGPRAEDGAGQQG